MACAGAPTPMFVGNIVFERVVATRYMAIHAVYNMPLRSGADALDWKVSILKYMYVLYMTIKKNE